MDEPQDRLSELPNSLILLILSFLPMREVVSTTLLSKRWQNLWTSVHCLNFCETISEGNDGAERFRKFVNCALLMWEGTRIQKFEIDIRSYFDKSLAGDLDVWVRFALKHKAQELNIHLKYQDWDWDAVYTAPRCLNTCTWIKKLSLVGCSLRVHEPPTWFQLESLRIDGFGFSERTIDQILWGCPRVEVFELRHLECNEDLSIQSTSLRKLQIDKYLFNEIIQRPSEHSVLRICCPNLETLEVSGCVYSECVFTDVSSLTDATLGFVNIIQRQRCGDPLRQILSAILHVQSLALSLFSSEVLCGLQRKGLLSPWPNVQCLKLNITYDRLFDIEHSDVMNLLAFFPNLKTLFIYDDTYPISSAPPQFNTMNYLEFKTNISKSSQLKTIKIKSFMCSSSIFLTIAFLLRQAILLEKFVIQIVPCSSFPPEFPSKVAKRVRNLPRSSPAARVITSW